jgi:hypothetical protein
VGLVTWRLTHPITRALTITYVAATSLMAFAPGLIWGLSHVIMGAIVFHVGLAAFLVGAWADRGVAEGLLARRVLRHGLGRTGAVSRRV